jgi:zinc/manganese transport system substrate-binding protein
MKLGIIPITLVAGLLLTACGNDDGVSPATTVTVPVATTPTTTAAPSTTTTVPAEPLPVVAVTYSVLAEAVAPLVEGVAEVLVVIPNGQDPHDFSPSAKDVERMSSSVIIIANGLGLEEGLVDVIGRLERDGVPVFRVSDHVTLLELGADDDHGHDHGHSHGHSHGHDHDKDDDHDHGPEDPHVWTDPLTFAEMLPALGEELQAVLGVFLGDAVTAAVAEMQAIHAEAAAIMAAVPDCTLVTGHDSMQYFARRYGCEVIGAVIPSLSTGAEPSAGELAALRRVASAAGVKAIFTELGTPQRVAEQISREVGVPLVELSTHVISAGGGYRKFLLDLARDIAEALS